MPPSPIFLMILYFPAKTVPINGSTRAVVFGTEGVLTVRGIILGGPGMCQRSPGLSDLIEGVFSYVFEDLGLKRFVKERRIL